MAFTAKIADIIAADKTGLLGCHASWQRVPLSAVASILNGAPFDAALFNKTSGMPLARIRDVLSGATSTYYTGEYDDAYLLERGDLLIGMDGDFHTGSWGAQRALLNQRVCKLTVNPDFYDKKLLGFALPGYLAAINANTPSITVKHLSSKTVGEIELPLPPRAEQTRIVETLEALLTDLDAGVAELKAAQRKLVRYRQSLLKAAVDGTLTAGWRADKGKPQEPAADLLQRILRERRARWEDKQRAKFAAQGKPPPNGWQAKYPEPVAPDVTDLPALPEGWVWATIDQAVAESLVGLDRGADHQSAKGAFGYIKMNNVSMSGGVDIASLVRVDATEEELDRYQVRIDDLLLNTRNSKELVGKVGHVRELDGATVYNNNLMRLRFDGLLMPAFACAQMCSPPFRSRMEKIKRATTSVAAVYAKNLFPLAIAVPPLEEQHAILKQLDTALTACDAQQAAIAHGLKQAAAQRRNLLKAAFAGQLVPQDPGDEPASALLARIRAAPKQTGRAGARRKA